MDSVGDLLTEGSRSARCSAYDLWLRGQSGDPEGPPGVEAATSPVHRPPGGYLEASPIQPATGMAPARAGLLGNPSDGYGGKAIARSILDFQARVEVRPSDHFRIEPGPSDGYRFPSILDACRSFDRLGCDDGLRLIRAAVRRFAAYWPGLRELPADHPRLRFSIRYETEIPRQVGLAGSSAIVVAALRALEIWFGVTVHPADLAELALAAELEDLGIASGAMDRVIQTYGGVMVMDLAQPRTEASYQPIDPALIPSLFLAWDPASGRPSGASHGPLRQRWLDRDPHVLGAIQRFREIVDEGHVALLQPNPARFRELMDENFDLRCTVFAVSTTDREMVQIARSRGAAAKLTGSGGAVVGLPKFQADTDGILEAYRAAGFRAIRLQELPSGSS